MSGQASPVITRFLPQLQAASRIAPILDLACGSGRNGLALLDAGVDVVFADRDASLLLDIELAVCGQSGHAELGTPAFWEVDFEVPGVDPFAGRVFGGVLVFRYLHRPLFGHLRQAIAPGGLVVYETFTVDQPRYGRPTNPDFLLRHGELECYFDDWELLLVQETVEPVPGQSGQRAIARLVARKPA